MALKIMLDQGIFFPINPSQDVLHALYKRIQIHWVKCSGTNEGLAPIL